MSKEYLLYPHINEHNSEIISYERMNLSFTYERDKQEEKISINEGLKDSIIILNDEDMLWQADSDNLKIKIDMFFGNLEYLFSKDGLVSKNAKIGIAAEWSSRTSRQKGIQHIATYDNHDLKDIYLDGVLEFDQGVLLNKVQVELYFYIVEEDSEMPSNESYKANTKGMRLGSFDFFELVLEGTGTDFPLNEHTDLDGPLWKVVATWHSPLDESFNDTVSILLNRAHKNFRYISQNHKKYFNEVLMDEIIYNSLEVIISKVVHSHFWEDVSDGNFDEGSVAFAVSYFIRTFELDTSSPEKLSESIRRNITF